MPTNDTIIKDEESATNYDRQARGTHWFGPEVVFGLVYEFVKPGDSLLDLGIGSGLSSILFHKAGLHVAGLDGSAEILQVCADKDFAVDLKLHDLRDLPLPYNSHNFDYIVCVAVINSFQDLGSLFVEISRIIRDNGIFAFTLEEQHPDQEDRYLINRVEVSEKPEEESAVTLYRHREETIVKLLDQDGFTLRKALEFLAFKYPAEGKDIYFKAYVFQKGKTETIVDHRTYAMIVRIRKFGRLAGGYPPAKRPNFRDFLSHLRKSWTT